VVTVKGRIAVFDLMRILAISMVLISHMNIDYSFKYLFNNSWAGNLFYLNLGNIGVLIFLCVSGAAMELNKKPMGTVTSYLKFMYRRIFRLYPAYWMSLLFAILLKLYTNQHTMGNLFWQFSGFSAFNLQWGGPLNSVGWCIGLLVCLYLLFPVISKKMEKQPSIVMVILFIVSMGSTYLLNITFQDSEIPYAIFIARWFPLCSIFYFCLGIYIVKYRLYPKWQDQTGILSWLGKLTFYVFLFHYPILNISGTAGRQTYLVVVILISMVAMTIDDKIQELLKGTSLSYNFPGGFAPAPHDDHTPH